MLNRESDSVMLGAEGVSHLIPAGLLLLGRLKYGIDLDAFGFFIERIGSTKRRLRSEFEYFDHVRMVSGQHLKGDVKSEVSHFARELEHRVNLLKSVTELPS